MVYTKGLFFVPIRVESPHDGVEVLRVTGKHEEHTHTRTLLSVLLSYTISSH